MVMFTDLNEIYGKENKNGKGENPYCINRKSTDGNELLGLQKRGFEGRSKLRVIKRDEASPPTELRSSGRKEPIFKFRNSSRLENERSITPNLPSSANQS